METFLGHVAADLYGRYGGGVSSLHAMFPSRRAALFFGEALGGIVTSPVWQPRSITIDEVAAELSGLTVGDRVRIIAELYRIYREFHPSEDFDTFYFWGELLVGDFDAIDKYLIDADMLFSNLVDLREIDGLFDYLSDDQRAAVERFWGSFSTTPSPEQRDFLTVWRTLGPVYHRFKARLRQLGIAYQGMVYREAA
ncbi:MAG: PD-(D/E)XK nuclease family protein, partial [Alistipes sp.]|nr:PD-(D/E)XK nuclease family protein [Alistipes sp.]